MRVDSITVSKGVTVSVGKFESVRIQADMTISLDKGEDHDNVFKAAYVMLDDQINAQVTDLQDVIQDTSIFKAEQPKESRKRR